MPMSRPAAAFVRRGARLLAALAALLLTAPPLVHSSPSTADTLPVRLSDAEFWKLSNDLSEPNGYFRSENLVGNEHTYQYVVPALLGLTQRRGVYLGVAPDQNFTYMIATQPKMAFIVDIRRGNLLQHLMYKAIFELSADRVEFVARLFSKPRPPNLTTASSVVDIFNAFARLETSNQEYVELYRRNLLAIRQQLTVKHRFALSASDLEQLETIYFAFFWEGPELRYSMSPTGIGGPRFGTSFPTYEEMAEQTDWDGHQRGYLATEENYKFVKSLEDRNLIVPVMGNFAGAKALRAVGKYVRDHGSIVNAFYVSNVEQYLFQDQLFDDFARNIATLPIDDFSVFIRSVSNRFGYGGDRLGPDGRASALDNMKFFIRDFQAGKIRSYFELNARSR